MNRLGDETSPYLRQHRDNPVDWYPWGEEAFAAARERDRPILLSVGYSACHWCHVMAHESFEDSDTAAIMNELFVNVKVDREERPDVDAIYMDAVQTITGHGGWPMTVFMAADGRPFFGGTYYPPVRRGQMPSFREIMASVDDAWANRRDDLLEQADRLTGSIGRTADVVAEGPAPGLEILDVAARGYTEAFDEQWGGFGGAPKFPGAMSLDTLLRRHHRTGDSNALRTVTTSLDAMASGGIYDHLGGGFARYAVDREWLVPHFEKMLYDNALLTRVYLHAWQVTGEKRFLQVVDETIAYVLRDLRDPLGGFHSAEDADSEGVEGRFYVWSMAEIVEVCESIGIDPSGPLTWWGATETGNFEGTNILYRPVRGDLIRPEHIEEARRAMFGVREGRVRPGLDDKVLTEWNALMLSSLAEAAAASGRALWRDAAVANGEFLITHLRQTDGRWLRSWQAGDDDTPARAQHLAYAQDHAALVDAFTRLAELTGEARWITAAIETADALLHLFADTDRGGFFTTGTDGEALVTRPKDLMDNATPSAQSLAAVALLRLGALTGEGRYLDAVEGTLALVGDLAGHHPTAFGHLLTAIDLHAGGITEVAIVGDRPDLIEVVRAAWRPNVVLAWGEPYDSPLWAQRVEGHAYVCENFACRAPVTEAEALQAQLAE